MGWEYVVEGWFVDILENHLQGEMIKQQSYASIVPDHKESVYFWLVDVWPAGK
jgi:hypothetical protein